MHGNPCKCNLENHHVYVGEVGYWGPFDPDVSKVGNQDYLEKELNELKEGYDRNLMMTHEHFEQRKHDLASVALAAPLAPRGSGAPPCRTGSPRALEVAAAGCPHPEAILPRNLRHALIESPGSAPRGESALNTANSAWA